MFFSDLRQNSSYFSDEVENKQRVNLSRFAALVLQNDIDTFSGIANDAKQIEISSFMNTILREYRDDCIANLPARLAAQEDIYKAILGADQADVLDRLMASYREKLLGTVAELLSRKDRGSGSGFNMRIDKDNLNYLAENPVDLFTEKGDQSATDEADLRPVCYNDRIGWFLKAVFEAYAGMSFAQREEIYYQSMMRVINSSILNRHILKLELHPSDTNGRSKTVYCKPYCLAQDIGKHYHYLAGYATEDRSNSASWKLASFRMGEIRSAREQKDSGILTQEKRAAIQKAIEDIGVQFLYESEATLVKVRFTEAGERLYKRILEQRPLYKEKTTDRVYTFLCPYYQARIYFFKFGKDALVLEPPELAKELRDSYAAAAEQYNTAQP